MAVDTRNRRASWFGYCLPAIFVFPDPDGAIDAEDRLQILWLYSGIAVAIPVVDVRATGVGSGPEQEKWRPKLPTISFAQRKREWKEHITAADERMRNIHTEAGRARREAIESERPKESVESQRARTSRHKKPGLEVQRPEFEKQVTQTAEPPRPPERVQRTPQPLEQKETAIEARVREIKRQSVEKRVEKSMLADEKRIRTEIVEARERKKKALINLEFAKEAQAKNQAVEDARNKQRNKALQKARAAKKRKAKRNK